jgi:hypothetical protein
MGVITPIGINMYKSCFAQGLNTEYHELSLNSELFFKGLVEYYFIAEEEKFYQRMLDKCILTWLVTYTWPHIYLIVIRLT